MRRIFFIFWLTGSTFAAAETKNYAILYLDKTVSMLARSADGSSRCDAAKKIARVSVRNFFEKWRGQAIDVRTFSEPGKTASLTRGFTDSKSNALAAIDSDPCLGPSTALADAICEGVDVFQTELAAVASDTETHFLLVAATDGEENSSIGPCSGVSWRTKVEAKIKESSKIRLNMNVFGQLDKVISGAYLGSAMDRRSLEFFSRISFETGGMTLFINDYADELPGFLPLFPNDGEFLAEMKIENVPTDIWPNSTDAREIGFKGLTLDENSFRKTKERITSTKFDGIRPKNGSLFFPEVTRRDVELTRPRPFEFPVRSSILHKFR